MKRFHCVCGAFFVVCLSSPLAHALNCEDGKVKIGDSKYEVSSKCGKPTYTDQTQVSRFSESADALQQDYVTVEYWLYNFGPDRFATILTFEKGKLISMRSAGYGKTEALEPDFNKSVEVGDLAVRVLFLYGPPSHKEERVETSVISRKDGATYPRTTFVEEWTYNLGHDRLLRHFYFENGRLKEMRRGARGF